MRVLRALFTAVLLLVAFPAAAEVRVTFYSHVWNAGGDGMYPHAFIRITGQPAWAQAPVDETYGFTTKQQALVFFKARGHVEAADAGYVSRSVPHFWVEITDDQYRALRERIDTWSRPPGSDYNLNRRNCIHFVADLAQHLGLEAAATNHLKPEVFLAETTKLNETRVALGAAPSFEPVQLTGAPSAAPLN